MTALERFIDVFDARPIVKRSRLRFGPLEARGVPAILLGVAAIVTASALHRAAASLPEAIRETRAWLPAFPRPQRMLPDA